MTRSPLLSLLLVACALGFFACRPVPGSGDSCATAPCASGLLCVASVCVPPESPAPDPDACEEVADCAVEGSVDGRDCVDGRCAFVACTFDVQCGERVCDRGTCALRVDCAADQSCGEGRVCDAGACRSACSADDECGVFAQCDAGRCAQRCFFDLMCGGDLCEDGLCVAAECAADVDCPADGGTYACEAGRCAAYVPCVDDAACYDADYRCNELGRCELRPACRVDADCGAEGLCLNALCRPATPCEDDGTCASAQECVASRCAARPPCRADADCATDQTCSEGRCQPFEAGTPTSLVVATPLGDCETSGVGACEVILFEGESVPLRVAAFDEGGEPLRASVDASLVDPALAQLVQVRPGYLSLTALLPGITSLRMGVGDSLLHESLRLRVLPLPAAGAAVLVVDESSGAPVEGVELDYGGDIATTDEGGLARLDELPAVAGETWLLLHRAAEGYAWFGPPIVGAMRVLWPRAEAPLIGAVERFAGFRAEISSSGDETGAIGLAFVLPGIARSEDARLATLLGPNYPAEVSVPLLGGARVPLPAGAALEVSLPLLGAQQVRDVALATTSSGRRGALAYEGRYPESELFSFVGNNDPVALALDLAARAPGMDAALAHVGVLAALPSVIDGDGADGWDDVDGDGDTTDRVPDYGAFPAIAVTPTQIPRERIGVRLGGLPGEARARAFAVAGLVVPGYGFQPTGIAALTPPMAGQAVEQLKVQPPPGAGLAQGERALVVEAVFDDPALSSTLHWRGASFAADLSLGDFLTPPTGAFVIEGVPAPDQRLLVLPAAPGADVYRVRLFAQGVRWDVWAAAQEAGRSLVLPAALGGTRLEGVEVYGLVGSAAERSVDSLVTVGSGPRRVADRARARAAAALAR